jgi:hypothetical protein
MSNSKDTLALHAHTHRFRGSALARAALEPGRGCRSLLGSSGGE